MRVSRSFRLSLIALATPLAASGAAAQLQAPMVQPLNPDADELAAEMRLLAVNPTDVNALVRAGELTLKLDDQTAAASFFARAERIDPRNPRIKAGQGSLLVQSEKPGEALRRFAEAEALGLDPRRFASDRGLAYDLIGEQDRAQRDYRLALKDSPNDETIRRYALSLGISGKGDLAYAELEPLLRRSDRGAWRARAFILAMTGDTAGAERIATNMMPPGLSQGLQPFFDRLSSLGPVDRAFAVHFGELRATPERIADTRLIPPLAPLRPDPDAPRPVAVAQVAPKPERQDDRRNRNKKKKGQPEPVQVASTPPPAAPLPQPPVYVASLEPTDQAPYMPPPASPPIRTPAPSRQTMVMNPASVTGAAPARAPVSKPLVSTPTVSTPAPAVAALPQRFTPPPRPAAAVGPGFSEGAATSPAITAVPTRQEPERPPMVVAAPVRDAPQPVAPAVSTPAIVAAPPPTAAAPPTPAPAPVRNEDSILANIIASVSAPAATDPPSAEPDPAPVAAPPPPVKTEPKVDEAAAEAKAAAAAKAAADKKALADKKAADAKKLADAKKIADAKKAAELKKKNDPKILEPERIWVQVAGGANQSTLPKEWARVREKAPAAFKGKSGWTTPLRATNRVLAGPFKTNEDARAFVNALSKEGLSAFVFTSEAGQKITKLPAK